MFAALLRRLTSTGLRRGTTGSTPWFIMGVVAIGARVLRRLAVPEEQVLYRTVVRSGDTFEIVARSGK